MFFQILWQRYVHMLEEYGDGVDGQLIRNNITIERRLQ